MSKRIPKSDFLEGLTLCEKNGLKFLSYSRKKLFNEEYLPAYIYGLISFEEFIKAYMILESWNDDFISRNKWENKMITHKEKLRLGAKLLYESYKNVIEKLINEGTLPEQIINIDIIKRYDEKYVKEVLENRTSFVYVNYNHNNNSWISTKDINPEKTSELINASSSIWIILTIEKSKLNINNINYEQYFKEINLFQT